MISSLLPRVNNMLEPPSPESRENPLESGAPLPSSSPTKPHSSSGPPMIPPVEVPDPKSNSGNPASSERNRRTIGGWFRSMTTKHGRNRGPAPRQVPSEAPPQSRIPSGTKATPPKEKPSTMAPGKRQAVSVPSSVDTENGYLTTRLSGRFTVVCHRLVYASYPFMDTITYCASQKKKPAKTTSHSKAGPSNVQAETKPESSGAQTNAEASVHFMRFADWPHNNSCSQPNSPRPLRAQKVVPPMFSTKRLVRKTM